MNTKTDLANRALSLCGETAITDIDDLNAKAARTCKQFIDDTIEEVLRAARWNCATARAILTPLSTPPPFGYTHAYQLPPDLLRLMEINGERFERSQGRFEIEGETIVSYCDKCEIRYIRIIPVALFEPLLAEAVALKLASKIIVPLGTNMERQNSLIQLYDIQLKQAQAIDAFESGNGANNSMRQQLQRCHLLRVRGTSSNINRWGYYSIPPY